MLIEVFLNGLCLLRQIIYFSITDFLFIFCNEFLCTFWCTLGFKLEVNLHAEMLNVDHYLFLDRQDIFFC